MSAESVAATVDAARAIARIHGYALTEHGSRVRDLDLVAIPWGAHVDSPDELIDALCDGLGCATHLGWDVRPHGRIGITLHGGMAVHWMGLFARPGYIDISVMMPDGCSHFALRRPVR